MSGTKIQVVQVKSSSGRTIRMKRTLSALGLGKIGASRVLPENEAVLGMVAAVASLVEVKEAPAK